MSISATETSQEDRIQLETIIRQDLRPEPSESDTLAAEPTLRKVSVILGR
jgi:hypothetical protein